MKPSHDEKKGFDESDVEVSLASGHGNILVKLGRKGIHSRVEEMTGEDVEGDNHVEEDGVEDKKDEENESAGMDGGDETFDDAEVDRENSVVGKNEGEEGDDNGSIEENDSEDINDQMEKESSVEETDHDGDDTSSHEVREEHYKADDASSAVSHDTRMEGMENENEHEENENEKVEDILEHGLEENTSGETDEGEKRKELKVEVGEMVEDDTESNVTNNESEESEGTENLEEIQQDSIDLSDSSEEKDTEDVGMDLDTLPSP